MKNKNRFLSGYAVLTGREVEACFVTPLGYIVLTVTLLLTGLTFYSELESARGNVSSAVRAFLGGSFQFWLVMLLVPPLISMRLFAEERRSGTIEMLLTAPVTDSAVVLSKFTGAMVFFGTMWLPTLLYVAIVKGYGAVPDSGVILTSYLGIFCLGAFFLSMGCLASALTTNQIVAAIVSVVINLALFFVPFLTQVVGWKPLRYVLEILWPLKHFSDSFSKGVVDSAHLIFYMTATGLMLFLTVRVLEARKWK